MAVDDRYTILGSGGVLKNKLGLTTATAVDRAMNEAASTEWAIIRIEPIPDQLDLEYLRSIHRRLLSPVLDWAGELRQAGDEVVAGGTGITYALSAFFRNGLDDVFGQLASEDYLRGLPNKEFVERLADRWGYLTATHPFRDGNSRTQAVYVDRLAVRAGHPIDWRVIDIDELRAARLKAVAGNTQHLATVLHGSLTEPGVSTDPLLGTRRITRALSTPASNEHQPDAQRRHRSSGHGFIDRRGSSIDL